VHFVNSALKLKYQPGQIEVNQLVVSGMVRVLRYQVVTILFLKMLLTLTMVSSVQAMSKNDFGLIRDLCVCVCRCMCKVHMYCNLQYFCH